MHCGGAYSAYGGADKDTDSGSSTGSVILWILFFALIVMIVVAVYQAYKGYWNSFPLIVFTTILDFLSSTAANIWA